MAQPILSPAKRAAWAHLKVIPGLGWLAKVNSRKKKKPNKKQLLRKSGGLNLSTGNPQVRGKTEGQIPWEIAEISLLREHGVVYLALVPAQ